MKKYSNIYDLCEKDQNICRHLYTQVNNLYRSEINKGKILEDTGIRYRDALHLLSKFLVECYHKKNLNYIESRHIYAFAEWAWETGYSKRTIFTTLSSTRDFYDRVRKDGSSLYLPTNDMLRMELEEIGFSSINNIEKIGDQRAWTVSEINKMKEKAIELGHEKYADIIDLSWLFGTRIHETIRLNYYQLENAIRMDKLTVKGKGGLVRSISIRNDKQREIIEKLLCGSIKGKVFVAEGEKAHEIIKKVQHFIYNHRGVVQEKIEAWEVFDQYCIKAGVHKIDGYDISIERGDITAHGLRHTWAIEYYLELIAAGVDDIAAKKIVSKELGHHRIEVTKVYLKI
ncbi:MAG TPA: tyrosine-type recombinase/integrase [Bacillota bacterium]|nr:tyrosine-type recombinase/integrase [Bacillota bacterium]